jgi:hypothetical protein
MSVTVVYNGRLGNNLFQYAFGRLLAEKFELKLIANPIPGFPQTYLPVEGRAISGDSPIVLRGHKPVIPDTVERSLFLTGYFQRYEYYLSHRETIKRWFESDFALREDPPNDEDVAVGIRRGWDYIPRHGLPSSYYIQAIERCSPRRVFICSDSPADPFVQKLARRFNASVRPAGALDNLAFLRRFDNLVISNSTFLWWAAFLSEARRIYAPRPSNGFWSKAEAMSKGVSLEIPDPSFIYLDAAPYRSEHVSERVAAWLVEGKRQFKRARRAARKTLRLPPKVPGSGYDFSEPGSDDKRDSY